jgi:hypothetical protein
VARWPVVGHDEAEEIGSDGWNGACSLARMHRLAAGLGGAVTIAAALLACGSGRLPAPSYVQQPTTALQPAQFPPPPARVEFVPEKPDQRGVVWLDGEWTWQGRRWGWKPGRWVVPPPDAAYSPWTMVRDATGNVLIAEGRWRDKAGRELPDPKPVAVGRPSAGTVVNAEGEEVAASPDVPAQDPPKSPGGGRTGTENGPPETPSRATPTGTMTTHEVPDAAADAGLPRSDAGAPTDAGFADVDIHDALERPDATPLGLRDPHP